MNPSASFRCGIVVVLLLALLGAGSLKAIDLANGLMVATPVPAGTTPAMDGTEKGWDLSAAEPVWYSNQFAKEMHASLATNYDDTNFYVYARISLPDRKLKNTNGPADPYWDGDLLELRMTSDPALPHPLEEKVVGDSTRVCHLSFWKNTLDGKDYIGIHFGAMHGGKIPNVYNPPGSQVVITEGAGEYIIQAVLPWKTLNVPDGKNPFKPGDHATAIFGLHWLSPTFFYSASAVYATNPGDFAFIYWSDWGQIEFSPTGNLKPRHETMEESLTKTGAPPVGVPIVVDVPKDGKISVNIFGDHGDVLRELTGGEAVKAGKFTAYWDGLDQWGFPLTPGTYKWGAYLSDGLKARRVGFVGSSGNPPYPTSDGTGGWGGDHGVPIATAADASGIYLGWVGSEAERQIIKLDYAGKTLWRKSPFVQGGFATLRAMTSNGKYVFLAYFGDHPTLCRLDAATGVMKLYGEELGKGANVPIITGNAPVVPLANSLPAENGMNKDGTAPECIGLAATDKEVFASIYSQNIIQVLDVESGLPTRTLPCPSPRGLALDSAGNLYAVSYGAGLVPQILRFNGVQGEAKPVVSTDLIAPYGVAVDAKGQICVTDEGPSQQVKIFGADGKLARTLGKEGGRPWSGTYDNTSYLAPSGVAADTQGAFVVAEASIPKIFDRIDAASGKTLTRWFGWPGYGVSNIGDSDDPMTSYYPFEPEGFARATAPQNGTGYPDAYWVPAKAEPDVNQTYGYKMLPYVMRLDNGKKYFVDDGNPHSISLIEGDNLLPVNYLDVRTVHDHREPEVKGTSIAMWIDQHGTHRSAPDDVTTITTVGGKPLPMVAARANSMWLDKKGNAYLLTHANAILEIPSEGFEDNGAIRWNAAKAHLVVSPVLPSMLDHLYSDGRSGMAGVRLDEHGNIYTCLETTVPALTPKLASKIKAMYPDIPQSEWCAYASDDLAKRMHEGLGHTAESNAVKFVKFGPDGKMKWIAGRKAVANPAPGEMYHFWSMAGLVGDRYFAGASEWGPIYFYTSDGFYVDSLMNDPAGITEPGPYTFGSENFSGRIETYEKLGKVFAYEQGEIYAVDGFTKDLKVEGEQRLAGTVQLDKIYASAAPVAVQTMEIAPVKGDVTQEATWSSVPKTTLTRGSDPLATAQVGYDGTNLYERVHVIDDTPLQNSADDLGVVFKGGDVVGLDLGPAGDRSKPALGDVRVLAAMVHGQPKLLGMKPHSKQAKQAVPYFTPASGTKDFDFVGEIPGGSAVLTPDADGKGYTALLTVPQGFIEMPITAGTPLKGDIEVLLSGTGQRGLQAVSRNWLYSGGHVQTTMVDDIPTEAWLYPQFWGDVTVK